jgi:Lrp/AsnC family leucine-responsive transcriptional regulator
MDTIDIEILKTLQDDGRITNTKLAKKIGISPPPTLERVKKLEKSGVIKKYVAVIDPQVVGINVFTFVEVTLAIHGKKAVDEFINAVSRLDEVMECHHITGAGDFLLKIAVKSIAAYEDMILHNLTELPHVQHLKTMVVLSTTKQETAYKIDV